MEVEAETLRREKSAVEARSRRLESLAAHLLVAARGGGEGKAAAEEAERVLQTSAWGYGRSSGGLGKDRRAGAKDGGRVGGREKAY